MTAPEPDPRLLWGGAIILIILTVWTFTHGNFTF
jgi:hypothetical protein